MLILHGSASGNSTDAASSLFRLARRYEITNLQLSSLEDLDLIDLVEAQLAIFVVSTTGNGDIPSSMHSFWSTLLRSDIDKSLLEDLDFVVVGLGDSKYKQFNWTAKKLRRRLLQLSAHEMEEMVLCDESAKEGMETTFLPFVKTFNKLLQTLSSRTDPLPKEILLPPLVPVKKRRRMRVDLADNDLDQRLKKWTIHQPDRLVCKARITKNERLTPESHFQDIRQLTFSLTSTENLDIDPGDVMSLIPSSTSVAVDRFLTSLHWQEDAETFVDLPETCKAVSQFDDPNKITLRELVRKTVPLHAVPPLSLFSQLRQFTTNEDFKEKFDEWEDLDGKDDVYDYLTRPRRTLLEVIEDFSSGIDVPVEYCIDLFGSTVPRSYSIAGFNKAFKGTTPNAEQTDLEIELLVALVKYQTKIKEPRQGFASRYLSTLLPVHPGESGAEFFITIEKPIVPSNIVPIPESSVPLLLICTGTGLAPLRFLILRLFGALDRQATSHRITLFFGCRSHDDDLVRLTIPEEVRKQINVVHAYSRLPDVKRTYVQDLVRQKSVLVQSILQDRGVVYLCGSSGAMPDAVRNAIDGVCGTHTVDTLEANSQWWQETW